MAAVLAIDGNVGATERSPALERGHSTMTNIEKIEQEIQPTPATGRSSVTSAGKRGKLAEEARADNQTGKSKPLLGAVSCRALGLDSNSAR